MPRDLHAEAEAAAGDFLAMFDEDRAAGRVRERADYLARFPAFQDRIAREFDELTRGCGAGDGAPAVAGERTIGRYRLLHELGHGGQGVVWLAHDQALDRRIALKVLDERGGWLSSARRERLQHEAEALARLDHPGICPIYEADLAGPTPFLAMRFVAGESLATRLQRAQTAPEPASNRLLATLPDRPVRLLAVLELIERIARALHVAHESGVVHRDVKPQNVMLTADDQPVVLDFGIARFEDHDGPTRTRSGELFGSLAYLPPERLLFEAAADRRGDVYALGVVLHECLTLQRPYAAPTAAALIAEVVAGNRRDARQLNRAIPRDLLLVLATALENDPARRYATALEFAEDLRRLRQNEPIAARPIGGLLRLSRWTRRHPVVAATTSLMLVALVVATVLLLQLFSQRRGLLAWQQVLEAVSSRDQDAQALGRVLAAAPYVPASKLDGPLIDLLTRDSKRLSFDASRLGAQPASTPFFAADDRTLFVPTLAGELLAIDLATGACTQRRRLHDGERMALRLGPHGLLLSSGLDDRVRCFDSATWSEVELPAAIARSNSDVRRVPNPDNHLPRLPQWSPVGRHFVLLGFDGALLGGAVDATAAPWRIDHPGWWTQQACFSPDGERLAVRWQIERQQGAAHVHVYAARDGRELHRLELGGQETMCCQWSTDGNRFAVGGGDGVVRVFDTTTWQCVTTVRTAGEDLAHVYWVDFTADGEHLLTCGFEGMIVWRLADGSRTAHFAAANGRPFHVAAWSPDGTRLAAVVKDGTIRFYETATWSQIGASRWHHRYPDALLWNHAGDRVVFQDGLGLQVAALQAPAPEFRPHRAAIVSVEFGADDRHVLT
ncbi:MAG: serine/threonine-protein kinase, partial [Planctomycetota bacterium]